MVLNYLELFIARRWVYDEGCEENVNSNLIVKWFYIANKITSEETVSGEVRFDT